jgi:hypothetical protein
LTEFAEFGEFGELRKEERTTPSAESGCHPSFPKEGSFIGFFTPKALYFK